MRRRARPAPRRWLRACRPPRYPCADCGAPTVTLAGRFYSGLGEPWPFVWPFAPPSEWYVVRDDVWREAGMTEDGGFLHVACLERRLGRPLTREDFPPYPVNVPGPNDSPDLAAALRRSRQVSAYPPDPL